MKKIIFIFLLILLNPIQAISEEAISGENLTKRMNQFFNVADRACYFEMKETSSFGKDELGYFQWKSGTGKFGPVLKKEFSVMYLNEDLYLVRIPFDGLMQNLGAWQKTDSYCYFDFKDMEVVKLVIR
jgi:hypothetical protein